MQKETIEMMNELGNTTYNAFKQLGEINLRVGEKLAQKQLAAMDVYMQAGVQQAELVASVKDMRDLVAAETALVKATSEKLLANWRESLEVAAEGRSELSAWMEKGVEGAAENIQKAAKAANVKAA